MKLPPILSLLLLWSTTLLGQTTNWITPTNATASGYNIWGGTWYTGPAFYAIDGTNFTKWTLKGMGYLDLDLGRTNLISGVEVYWDGSVSSGNTINLYVDGRQVLTNEHFAAISNIRYFPAVLGRFIRYETVPLPHNELGQIATWSEVASFRAFIETLPLQAPQVSISRAVQLRWPTEEGIVYQPQISADGITWQDYGAAVIGEATEKQVFYVSEGTEKAFFRIEAR
jgi:hypothetical protein